MKLVREHLNEISLGGSHLERMGMGYIEKMKKVIKKWLDEHNIEQAVYTINDNLTIDVKGDVCLLNKVNIPNFIKFNHITGSLNLSYTKITSLPNGLEVDKC